MKRAVFVLAISVLVGSMSQASSVSYPSKVVKIIVPTAAGGTTDILARLLAKYASTKSHVQWIIENRPGATGTLGTENVVRAAPDGYTLGFNNTGILINPLLRKDVSFDPLNDMVPIGPVAEAPMLLAINGELPAKSLQEFIALVKASPGKFNYASAGPGSTQHLASARFAQLAGVDMVHVPYRGTPQAIADLVQGGVQMFSISLGPVAGFLENKRIRVLAAATERRIPSLPDIPTSEEAGLRGYTMTTWFGLFAPRGTPDLIVRQLNGYISEMHQTDDARKVLAANSIEPMQMSPDRFQDFLEKDRAGWENVVRESGVQLK